MELDNEARLLLVLFLVLGLIVSVTFAALSHTTQIPSFGTIMSIGFDVVESRIDWGLMEPDSIVQRLLHVTNNGTVAETLTIYALDWQPQETEAYIVLSSPNNNTVIQAQEQQTITLTLTVSPNIHGINSFSFDILLKGEQT